MRKNKPWSCFCLTVESFQTVTWWLTAGFISKWLSDVQALGQHVSHTAQKSRIKVLVSGSAQIEALWASAEAAKHRTEGQGECLQGSHRDWLIPTEESSGTAGVNDPVLRSTLCACWRTWFSSQGPHWESCNLFLSSVPKVWIPSLQPPQSPEYTWCIYTDK